MDPHFKLPQMVPPPSPAYIMHFIIDPLNQLRESCARNVKSAISAPLTIGEPSTMTTPVLLLMGGKDGIVDNEKSKQFIDQCGAPIKK